MEHSLPTTSADSPLSILDKSRLQAEVNLLFIQEEIGRRVLDPTMHTKDLFAAGEHSYKVSGMAVKQAEKVSGPGFSITIVLPGTDGHAGKEIIIGHSTKVALEDELPEVPEWMRMDELTGNLIDG